MNLISKPDHPLAAPGAGLPWLELQIARALFGWQRGRARREEAAARIEAERSAIFRAIEPIAPEQRSQPVLIDRLRGMEDSSRRWSVLMTLEHLRIVNAAIADAISRLGRGEVPALVASTAAVKPNAAVDASVIAAFAHSCDAVAESAAAVPDLRTARRYAHPWFGPLDAAGWHFLAGFHLRLHRGQLVAIRRGLLTIAPKRRSSKPLAILQIPGIFAAPWMPPTTVNQKSN